MRRLYIRFALLFVILAVVLVPFFIWLQNRPRDRVLVDIPPVNTTGYIAALEESGPVERLVSITPEGQIRRTPDPTAAGEVEVEDGDFTWQPDGRRIVFVSNRSEDGSYQLFEWAPDRDGEPYMLTPLGSSRRSPWFSGGGAYCLFVSSGVVYELRYPKLTIGRVMPPSAKVETTQSEEEIHHEGDGHDHSHELTDQIADAWDSMREQLRSDGFEKGFVDPTDFAFVGVAGTDRGKALIFQSRQAKTIEEAVPIPSLAADRIDVDMHPTMPLLVVSVVNFRYPILDLVPPEQIDENGKVKTPYSNALWLYKLDGMAPPVPIFLDQGSSQAMVSPAISPDGSKVAVVQLEKENNQWARKSLLVAELTEWGIQNAKTVTLGDVSDPSWSPDGTSLVFIRDGDVCTVRADGTGEKNLTNGKGRYRSPKFSPMK